MISKSGRQVYVVSFEGADACGKTSHLAALSARLCQLGIPHITANVPGSGGAFGKQVRELLLRGADEGRTLWTEALIFAGARECALNRIRQVVDSIEVGFVLLDRWDHSSAAYQSCGSTAMQMKIMTLSSQCEHITIPDHEFYFHAALPDVKSRLTGKKLDYFEAMGDAVLIQRAKDYENLYVHTSRAHQAFDTSGPVDAVQAEVYAALDFQCSQWHGTNLEGLAAVYKESNSSMYAAFVV